MSTIAERIKKLRKAEGLTQQRFADRLGLKQNTIATYEMGKTALSDRTISDICREFGVNENWLRNGIGEMKSECTQREKLNRFFANVLSTAPDDRSAFVAALDDLPEEFWPLVVELARNIVDNLPDIKNAQAESQPGRKIIKIAGRDGSMQEHVLTDEDMNEYLQSIDQLADARDDL